MAGSYPSSVVTMEVLVKGDEVFPVGISLELFYCAIDWTPFVAIFGEYFHKPVRELKRYFPQIKQITRASWAFDFKAVPKEVVKFLQGFNYQEIDWKPYRASPV